MEECFSIIKNFTDSFTKERKQSSPKQQKPDSLFSIPERFKCKVTLKRWSKGEVANAIHPKSFGKRKSDRNDSNDEHNCKRGKKMFY